MQNASPSTLLGHIESMQSSELSCLSGIQLFIKVSWDFKSTHEKKQLAVKMKESCDSIHAKLTQDMGNLTLESVPKKPVSGASRQAVIWKSMSSKEQSPWNEKAASLYVLEKGLPRWGSEEKIQVNSSELIHNLWLSARWDFFKSIL